MFESLQDGLRSALKTLQGKGKLTEANMREGLRLVEQSLLEADVSYPAVKAFMASVSEQALGQKVLLALDRKIELQRQVAFTAQRRQEFDRRPGLDSRAARTQIGL